MSRSEQKALAALIPLATLSANAPMADLRLSIDRLRSSDGLLHLCITQNPRHFPDCDGDANAIHKTLPATERTTTIGSLAPGPYAVSVLHDENGNGRMDAVLGIPREGFGFSRNPAVRFGPPDFEDALIELDAGSTDHVVRLRYIF